MEMEIKVRAVPAPGHNYRRRAGHVFSQEFKILKVVENPSGDGEISPAQVELLREDGRLHVVASGADEGLMLETAAQLAAKDAELLEARRKLSDAGELVEEMKREGERLAMESAKKIASLETEIENLRGQLARASQPAPSASKSKR